MAVIVEELLGLALDLARRAGDLLLTQRPANLEVDTKSSPTDVVTDMDTAAERLIVGGLRAARPGDGVLAEEGASAESSTGVRWVVDPLDGTVNYLYGIPDWAVSIAAEVDGETAVGVVNDPSKKRVYAAVRGRGATCNDRPLRCSARTDLAQALVGTGFGYAADRRAAQARVLDGVLPKVRDIRRIGAAALDLCSVAAGRLDAFYERGLNPWDLAAGGLIAREAGAVVGGLRGGPAGPDLVIAAPPALFGPLHDVLDGLGAADGP
ncbi:MAG TPA: inositol monophosphatase family protein [Mycobacteriales bacterium]|jgi:fructose-1,6-bisphosphatase/inositol monophosphatase family enzyme|nr:inositol monophosphatase family protein [Mycobacteriales bacterium]